MSNNSTSLSAVASLPSPPLHDIIAQMNGESNNHFAELLFRNVALAVGARGSATSANSLLGRFLTDKVHVTANSVFAADGSGLSTLDRVTPRSMVQLLDYAKKASWGSVLEQSLPIAGRTETLARRMRRHIRSKFVLCGNTALFYAGTFGNPHIISFYHRFQIGIG